jgi:integrase/recombinase XerD
MNPPKTLDVDEQIAFLRELEYLGFTRRQRLIGYRNFCAAVTMIETGLRVGELCALYVSDLWFLNEPVTCLVVRSDVAKNNKEREIPISKRMHENIKLLEEEVWQPFNASCSNYAFFSSDPTKQLSTRTVERFILEAGRKSLHRDITPHVLRHTFASKLMRKTNSRNVQALLGHDSLQSTQIYMHPNMDDLRKAIDSL